MMDVSVPFRGKRSETMAQYLKGMLLAMFPSPFGVMDLKPGSSGD